MAGKDSAEGFLGSVLKYSAATYVGFIVSAAGLVLRGILGPTATADAFLFMSATATLMNVGILGLDQSLLRFYADPPAGHSGESLFALCLWVSMAVMALLGIVCSVFFPNRLAALLSLEGLGPRVIPLLFCNAALYMAARYWSVLLRLEGRLGLYTVETILMQACFNLFYLLAGFFTPGGLWYQVFSIAAFAALAAAMALARPGALRLGRAPAGPAVKRLVPYGLALAPTQIMLMFAGTFSQAFLGNTLGSAAKGVYGYGVSLAQVVAAIQAGFATFWGPYVFSHYKTDQRRIARVHEYLNVLIFGFFCCLVAFEDIIFLVFPAYKECLAIFPLLMLNVVFTILCEGTVYGIAIAKKPLYDTAGIALYAGLNIALCTVLVPRMGLLGAALALAAAGCAMFLFRTLAAQRFYKTIVHPWKTAFAFALAVAVAGAGTVLAQHFLLKGLCCFAAAVLYCLLYKGELLRCIQLALSALKSLLPKKADPS